MRKFKFKSGDMVVLNVNGEKHIGKVISGGIYEDDYILKYYYSVDDLNNGDMFCVEEKEIERASKQDEERLLTNLFSGIFGGGR
jgi:hypothetical protein